MLKLTLLQQTIQLSYSQLLMFPALLIGGIVGWRRGWKEEAITTVGLLFTLILFSNETVASSMAALLNRIISAFGVFINALFGGDSADSGDFITSENFDTFRIVSFTVGVIVSYIVGSAIGRRNEIGRGGKLIGVGVGMFNAYLVLSRYIDYWVARQRAGADLPLQEGTNIVVSPISQTNELRANLPTIFALLFLVVLIVTFFRLPKIRQ